MSRSLTVLCLTVVILCLAVTPGHAFRVGVGGFGFRNFSIDDPRTGDGFDLGLDHGTLFGVKGRLGVVPFLGIEGVITWVDYGDFQVQGGNVDASMTAFEVNGILGGAGGGLGVHFYSLFGVGSYRFDTDPGGTETEPGWNIGTGVEVVAWPNVGIDGSLRFRWVSTEGESLKDLGLYLGANIYFGS